MKPSNVLKISTLNQEWYDKDGVLLHACFQLLVNFIHEETSFINKDIEDFIDWEENENRKLAKQEMLFLYDWWQKYNSEEFRSLPNWEDDELENEMLKRLIDVRWAMWT
ncbi:hypothetical protein [Moraxella oblonga]|uniref:hypothetical protein n=1 Tax=Moraxella oblonga TaxID=200413 RepID=UPI0008374923|nr:hypothetical protein [Moraxella oblonga]